jgi:hypothetical protein
LQEAFTRFDRPHKLGSRSKEELRRAAERRALQVIVENENGMIGDPGMFVPRQYRQHAEDELRAHEVFEIAMRRLGAEDRDAFFMPLCKWLNWLQTRGLRKMIGKLSSSFFPNSATDTPF